MRYALKQHLFGQIVDTNTVFRIKQADQSSLNRQINRPPEMRQVREGEALSLEDGNTWNAQLSASDEVETQQDAEMSLVPNPMSGEEILGQGTHPGGEEFEIDQDMEMSLELDSASGELMVEQDTLALESQARSQDVERDHQDEEKQVAILLEVTGAESTTGEQNIS